MPPPTKPKPPMEYAADARNTVRNGKLRLGGRSPVTAGHYQLLPPHRINRLYAHIFHSLLHHTRGPGLCPMHPQQVPAMKKTLKTLAVAVALSSAALLVHYLIGSMSY